MLSRPPFCNGGTPEDPLNLNNVGVDAEQMKKELEAEANEIQVNSYCYNISVFSLGAHAKKPKGSSWY